MKRSGTDVDWSTIAATPDDVEAASKPEVEKIDPKELLAAAAKKKKISLPAFQKVEESKSTLPEIIFF